MKVESRQANGSTVVDIVGDIDLYNSPEIRKVLLEAIKQKNAQRVVVNLTGVKYIDSSGVASLVEGLKVSRTVNVKFVLFGLSHAAKEVLELSRLIKVFEVYENEEAALKG